MQAQTFTDILKFNPYHDSRGRFSSANGAASFTYAPGKSKAHDLAIAREKERYASMIGADEKKNDAGVSEAVKNMVGDEATKEYDTANKPNKYDPEDPRWGTEPGEYTVYRSGDLSRNVVFTASTYDGAKMYAEAFPTSDALDITPMRSGVYSYTVQIKKPYVSNTMQETYKDLFGKDIGQLTGNKWVAADNKIAKELTRRGYDAWTLKTPAPPAKKEMNLLGNAKVTMTETSRKVPDHVKSTWEKEATQGGFFAHSYNNGKSTGLTIDAWFKTPEYQEGRAEGKWA